MLLERTTATSPVQAGTRRGHGQAGPGLLQDSCTEDTSFLFLLSQTDEFFSGETAQGGQTGQQRGPEKGQGLLVALQVILQWQKSPEESVQEFCSFQT